MNTNQLIKLNNLLDDHKLSVVQLLCLRLLRNEDMAGRGISLRRLARELRVSVSGVRVALNKLRALEMISKLPTKDHRTDRYTLHAAGVLAMSEFDAL